jgi:Mce-associated membrane protein
MNSHGRPPTMTAPEHDDSDDFPPENQDHDEDEANLDDMVHCESADLDDAVEETPPTSHTRRAHRIALVVTLLTILALAALGARLGWQWHHNTVVAKDRAAYVQAARQGALALTTIDWRHADADVQRIIGSATGMFYDDFSKRTAPLIDMVKQTQSVSTGTVVSAGIESQAADTAQVLVAMKVDVSNAGAAQQPPRSWRMRMTVQKVGDQVKVSDVGFVP